MELNLIQNPILLTSSSTSYNEEDQGMRQYDDEEGVVTLLFANELDHMPCLSSTCDHQSDFVFSVRHNAISILSQTKFSYNLDPFLVYLAINYLDRFLSKQETFLQERKQQPIWITHILVVASLSLAAKMTNHGLSSLLLSHLQVGDGFRFDAQAIHRMENIILSTLQWRMRSITPFSFLQYFVSLLKIEDSSLIQSLKHRASDIIFDVQHELKLLEYKPSIIAASVLLCAVHDLTPLAFSSSKATLSSCEYVDNDILLECFGVIQKITREGYEMSDPQPTASGTVTPISVLDQQSTISSNGDIATNNAGFVEKDRVKRQRLNGLCDNVTFKISHFHPR